MAQLNTAPDCEGYLAWDGSIYTLVTPSNPADLAVSDLSSTDDARSQIHIGFDTSAIPAAATVVSSQVGLYCTSRSNTLDNVILCYYGNDAGTTLDTGDADLITNLFTVEDPLADSWLILTGFTTNKGGITWLKLVADNAFDIPGAEWQFASSRAGNDPSLWPYLIVEWKTPRNLPLLGVG